MEQDQKRPDSKQCNCKSEHCAHDGCEQEYWRVLDLMLDELI